MIGHYSSNPLPPHHFHIFLSFLSPWLEIMPPSNHDIQLKLLCPVDFPASWQCQVGLAIFIWAFQKFGFDNLMLHVIRAVTALGKGEKVEFWKGFDGRLFSLSGFSSTSPETQGTTKPIRNFVLPKEMWWDRLHISQAFPLHCSFLLYQVADGKFLLVKVNWLLPKAFPLHCHKSVGKGSSENSKSVPWALLFCCPVCMLGADICSQQLLGRKGVLK